MEDWGGGVGDCVFVMFLAFGRNGGFGYFVMII